MSHTLRRPRGFTLLESVISIFLLSIFLVSLLAAFFVSRLSTERARHRLIAMDAIREYMEQEIRYGYLGGSVDGDYYGTVSSSNPISVTIDDRRTVDTSDDLLGSLTPSPYPAATASVSTSRYKTIGFSVAWTEDTFGGGTGPACTERIATYVSEHN